MPSVVSGSSVRRLLVRLPNWVGDIMMALPAIQSLRGALPEAHLIGMARPEHIELAKRIDGFDEVLAAPPRRSSARLRTMATAIRGLRSRKLDAAVLFATSFESALTVWLAGIPIRVGHETDHRAFMLNHPVRVREGHPSDQCHDVVEKLVGGESQRSGGSLRLTDRDRLFADRLFESAGYLPDVKPIFVNPASAKTQRAWASDRFLALAEHLVGRFPDTPVLVHNWHPFACPEGWPPVDSIRVVADARLTELAGVIERCSLYVGNDSGPIHIAAALGVTTVGIYGPTSPQRTSPRGAKGAVHIPVSAGFECSPCREQFFKECPSPPTADQRPPCLNAVSVDLVAQAVNDILLRSDRGSRPDDA